MRIRTVLMARRTLLATGLLAILGGSLVASAALLQVESATLATFSLPVELPPPLPPDFEGCSPGFWKQPHHFENWPGGFSTDDLVSSVFGSGAPPDLTLLEALEQGGGGVNALLRQAVAALLNAAHAEVNYPITLVDVISLTQAALLPGGDVQGTKDTFKAANELGCGLSDGEDEDGEDGEDDDGDECEDDGGDECEDDEGDECEALQGNECENGNGDDCGGHDEGECGGDGGNECESDEEEGCDEEVEDSSDSSASDDSDVSADQTPETDNGCGVDYWGNEENLTEWPEGLSPVALFSEVFGIVLPESPTLFEALSLEGNPQEVLMREATAALLNALSFGIQFETSAEEVIVLFQTAYLSGDPQLIADTTEQFEGLNEGNCPGLGNAEADSQTESDVEALEPTATATSEEPAPTETPEPDS